MNSSMEVFFLHLIMKEKTYNKDYKINKMDMIVDNLFHFINLPNIRNMVSKDSSDFCN